MDIQSLRSLWRLLEKQSPVFAKYKNNLMISGQNQIDLTICLLLFKEMLALPESWRNDIQEYFVSLRSEGLKFSQKEGNIILLGNKSHDLKDMPIFWQDWLRGVLYRLKDSIV